MWARSCAFVTLSDIESDPSWTTIGAPPTPPVTWVLFRKSVTVANEPENPRRLRSSTSWAVSRSDLKIGDHVVAETMVVAEPIVAGAPRQGIIAQSTGKRVVSGASIQFVGRIVAVDDVA